MATTASTMASESPACVACDPVLGEDLADSVTTAARDLRSADVDSDGLHE